MKTETFCQGLTLPFCLFLAGCMPVHMDPGVPPTRARSEIVSIAEKTAWPGGKRDPDYILESLSYDFIRKQWFVGFMPDPCPPGGDIGVWVDDTSGKAERMPSM